MEFLGVVEYRFLCNGQYVQNLMCDCYIQVPLQLLDDTGLIGACYIQVPLWLLVHTGFDV